MPATSVAACMPTMGIWFWRWNRHAIGELRSVGAQRARLERAVQHFIGGAERRCRIVVVAGEPVLLRRAHEAGGERNRARRVDADVHHDLE